MNENSSTFLGKGIVLLVLFLICVGASMYMGKELGSQIMATTRSNIEEKFPENTGDGTLAGDEMTYDFVGGRGSFDYNSSEFGANRFPSEWADPTEEELDTPPEAPEVVISPVGPDGEIIGDPDNLLVDNPVTDDPPDDPPIFELGDPTTYRIQVGTYNERQNAENVWGDLTQAGYNSSIASFAGDDGEQIYKVTVGVYNNLEDADRVADELRRMGFDGWVQEVIYSD